MSRKKTPLEKETPLAVNFPIFGDGGGGLLAFDLAQKAVVYLFPQPI